MANKKYEENFIINPKLVNNLPNHPDKKGQGYTFPYQVYLDSELMGGIKGSIAFVEMGWRTGITNPNPLLEPHQHPYDEVLVVLGSNYDKREDLQAELEIQMDDEKYVINETSVIVVPKGVTHTIRQIKVDKPYYVVAAGLKTGKYSIA